MADRYSWEKRRGTTPIDRLLFRIDATSIAFHRIFILPRILIENNNVIASLYVASIRFSSFSNNVGNVDRRNSRIF